MLPAFLETRGLVRQHIDSFNYFVNTEISKIVAANNLVTVPADPSFFLRYEKIHISEPSIEEDLVPTGITPQQCRLRDISYSAPIVVQVSYKRGNDIVKKEVLIGQMPIMLRSDKCCLNGLDEAGMAREGECPIDPGGYFIIKGVEKVILIQEQLSKNRIILDKDSKGDFGATVTSSTHHTKTRTQIFCKKDQYVLRHNTFSEDIPIAIVFKGMGIVSDQEIVQLVGTEPFYSGGFASSLECCVVHNIRTQQQALDWIGAKLRVFFRTYGPKKTKSEEALDKLVSVIFSHVPATKDNLHEKALYIAVIVRRIMRARQDPTLLSDKDYYGNKRLELAGQLLSILFEDLFKRFNKELQRNAAQVFSKPNRAALFDISKWMRQETISRGLAMAISTGNWRVARFHMDRAGVTQVLSRLSFISCLGMMTRITSQFEKTRKVSGPRALQASQWGMLCPSDTPEGESCGLVKNLALLTYVTTDEEVEPLRRLIYSLGIQDSALLSGHEIHSKGSYLVFLNGTIVGVHRNPVAFVTQFRLLRRSGLIPEMVAVHYFEAQHAINISCDGGRVCRPLIIVDPDGKSRLTQQDVEDVVNKRYGFNDFIRMGKLEFLDVNEENNARIAVKEQDIIPGVTTHVEIEPLALLGVVAGLIPYPHHNQSPRNTYQCAMGKQAIGTIGYNQLRRMDTLLYLLVYPQKPMMRTKTIGLINFEQLPAGQNATVAVMSYSGYDIEDAIVLNKYSVDRGFGRCLTLRRYSTVIKKYSNSTHDRVVKPPLCTPENENDHLMRRYRPLDPTDGIAMPGEEIKPGQIYVNRQCPRETSDTLTNTDAVKDSSYQNSPSVYKGPEGAATYVDRVILTCSEDDHFIVKAMFRNTRTPELGDKFSSRHGQKGVVGIIVNQEDLPFTDQGICPDIIMNPHGFPSRMTVGKLMELIGGKAGVCEGVQHDATVFAGDPVEAMSEVLVKHGYCYDGKEALTSGITGESISAYVFTGPIYYQKLKHMVLDKMHARAKGPRALLTRQPTAGRSRDGGLRLGEMERDCLVAYGTSGLLRERLLHSSDVYSADICKKCGLLAQSTGCRYCETGDHISQVEMPYAAKLLFQELMAMNVVPRVHLEKK